MKSEKKKNKGIDKIKELEIEVVRSKNVNNRNKLQSELKELNKIIVIDKNLQEIKQEILADYAGDFEKVGKISVGD